MAKGDWARGEHQEGEEYRDTHGNTFLLDLRQRRSDLLQQQGCTVAGRVVNRADSDKEKASTSLLQEASYHRVRDTGRFFLLCRTQYGTNGKAPKGAVMLALAYATSRLSRLPLCWVKG